MANEENQESGYGYAAWLTVTYLLQYLIESGRLTDAEIERIMYPAIELADINRCVESERMQVIWQRMRGMIFPDPKR